MNKTQYEVGDRVVFADLLGHDEEAWGMDRVDFMIMKNYLNKRGKITSVITDVEIPHPFNTFLTVEFKDGYVLYDANQFAFIPAPVKEPKVLDFMAAKNRLSKSKERE